MKHVTISGRRTGTLGEHAAKHSMRRSIARSATLVCNASLSGAFVRSSNNVLTSAACCADRVMSVGMERNVTGVELVEEAACGLARRNDYCQHRLGKLRFGGKVA